MVEPEAATNALATAFDVMVRSRFMIGSGSGGAVIFTSVLSPLTWFRISPFYAVCYAVCYAVTDGGVAIRSRQICKFLKMWTLYPHSVYSTMI